MKQISFFGLVDIKLIKSMFKIMKVGKSS
jgi:hypothetical protein